MSLLLETIHAADGHCEHLAQHIKRMNRSRKILQPGEPPITESEIKEAFTRLPPSMPGIWKIRILYDDTIKNTDASPYTPLPLKSAALIDIGIIDYSHKWADRTALHNLNQKAKQRGADIALFVRDGLITDFFHANAAFFDGSRWWTPARPLLIGTRRERLLAENKLHTAVITPDSLPDFQLTCPVNAMLDLGQIIFNTEHIIRE